MLRVALADLAQLVRASGCGSEGRGFDPPSPPQVKSFEINFEAFFMRKATGYIETLKSPMTSSCK